jgi:hypothetical protein
MLSTTRSQLHALNYTLSTTRSQPHALNHTLSTIHSQPHIAAKRKNTQKGFQNTDAAFAYFKRASKKSRLSKGLTKHQTTRSKVKDPKDLSKAAAKYKKFLSKVHNTGNRHLFTITFSQSQINSTKVSILKELVSKLNKQKSNNAVAQALFDTTLGDN